MQIHLNTCAYQSRLNFKASFANNSETKKSLKKIAKENPNEVLDAIEALTQSSSKDIFSIAQGDRYFEFNITNENLQEKSRHKTVKYTERKDNLLDKILHMHVSKGYFDTVGDDIPLISDPDGWNTRHDVDWRKGYVSKVNKQSNANFILGQIDDSRKHIKKIDEKIEKLENIRDYYIDKQNKLLKSYAEGVIESLFPIE